MKEETIIGIVRTKGNVGCTKVERYIDLPDGIMEKGVEVAQITHFDDGRGLAVCGLDDCDELVFSEYNELSNETKNQIEIFLKGLA